MEHHAGADNRPAAHRGPHAGAGGYFLKELQPIENPPWSKTILKDFSPWREPMLEQGKRVRSSRKELLQTDHNHPFPIHPALFGRDEMLSSWGGRSNGEPGKKSRVGGRCCFYLPLFLIIETYFIWQ